MSHSTTSQLTPPFRRCQNSRPPEHPSLIPPVPPSGLPPLPLAHLAKRLDPALVPVVGGPHFLTALSAQRVAQLVPQLRARNSGLGLATQAELSSKAAPGAGICYHVVADLDLEHALYLTLRVEQRRACCGLQPDPRRPYPLYFFTKSLFLMTPRQSLPCSKALTVTQANQMRYVVES